MRFGLFFAALAFIIGARMLLTAISAAIRGKILVRRGIRTEWQPAPSIKDVWGIAFRDGLMGIMLIILGIALLT